MPPAPNRRSIRKSPICTPLSSAPPCGNRSLSKTAALSGVFTISLHQQLGPIILRYPAHSQVFRFASRMSAVLTTTTNRFPSPNFPTQISTYHSSFVSFVYFVVPSPSLLRSLRCLLFISLLLSQPPTTPGPPR